MLVKRRSHRLCRVTSEGCQDGQTDTIVADSPHTGTTLMPGPLKSPRAVAIGRRYESAAA
jgi:hypothetical protein